MPESLCLNGTWGLIWAEGSALIPAFQYVGPKLEGHRMLPAEVPAPLHKVLQDAGIIEDPNFGLNSLRARWVEEMYWVYRHTFEAPREACEQAAWLVFEQLEMCAKVWLNGEEIGTHANVHRPARFNVTGRLRPGENLLVVQLTTGMHEACDKPVREYMPDDISLLTKRQLHRKPQYQCGWDWNCRLMNVGILGDVRLEWSSVPRLDQASVFALVSEDLTSATLHARAFVDNHTGESMPATVRVRVAETGQEVALPVRLEPGLAYHEATVEIDSPRLWWPVGHGEQFLYEVQVALEVQGERQAVVRRTGMRRVEIDQSPHPVEGRYFIVKVNNRPIFCKGANWVPPSLLHSLPTLDDHRALVGLALEANFNTLRVWGGGVFAHKLLEVCDQAGILVWHDLLFACAKYPGDDPEFAAEVRREVTWAMREMGHHPSLVVWCGNNEIEWGDWSWGYDQEPRTHPHYALFHHDLPKIALEENPAQAYWISSPFSPDYKHPNDPTVGDQHPWGVSMNPGGADWWDYRGYTDRFPNEGGVLGASPPATLRQFLPPAEQHLLSLSWVHHDNPFACTDGFQGQGNPGHAYQTVMLWTGRDPFAMDLEEYAFVSGLLQAEGLAEYAANYRRRMFSSASAIFWSYNDSWPVTHGWTIVDYYRRRKLAYYAVRRAFQPITVVVAEEEGQVKVFGVNDTPQEWAGEVRWGLFLLAGGYAKQETGPASLPANCSVLLAAFPRSEWQAVGTRKSGAFAALLREGELVAQHRLFVERFGGLEFVVPEIKVRLEGDRAVFTSNAFAWGVCLDLDGEKPLADNCFDLLPETPYSVPWEAAWGRPEVVKVGNRDAVKPQGK